MRLLLSWTAASVLLSAGCGREPLSGPPTLRLGRDECIECGMMISEDRCSSGMLIEEDGRRSHVLFDDIGCMLDVERGRLAGARVLERYVHDHQTREWVETGEAWFVLADPDVVPTPMGTGIVAFRTRERAENEAAKVRGRLLRYPELAEARRRWMEQRYGKPRDDQ